MECPTLPKFLLNHGFLAGGIQTGYVSSICYCIFLTLKTINAELKESATMAYNACLKASYSFDYKLIKIFLHLLLHFSSVNLGISVTILITHTCNVCIYAHHLICWVLPIFVSSLVGLKLNTTSWLLYGMITC